MSNFEGNVKKNANSFRPQQRGSDGAGVGRVVAGVYAGQDAPVVFEKANQPVLDTDKTPRTDGAGESELGLSGQVDHPDRDGGAKYLASRIAREYKRIVSDGADLESLSEAQRRQMRDELIAHIYDGDGQHPSGEAASQSQADVLTYITGVANVLFGLADEIPATPAFLRAPVPPTSDDLRVGRIGADYLKPVSKSASGGFLHKMAGGADGIECPFCSAINPISKSGPGLQVFTCTHCAKYWEADPSLMLRKSDGTPANPELAALKKQLAILTERLRGIIARGAGVNIDTTGNGGNRFVTKDAGNGNDPKRLLKHALDNGIAVPFSGADPRSEAQRAGSGRKFSPRA